VRDLAEAQGDREAFAAAELSLIDRLGPDRESESAQRLRALAAKLEGGEPGRAAELLARAFALSPAGDDPQREADLRDRSGDSAGAVPPLLRLARKDPFEGAVLSRLARALRSGGAEERAAAVESLAAFADPARRFSTAAVGHLHLDDALRAQLYQPVALGPVAQLLRALGPALGAAFPGDLSRHGVTETDLVGPLHAPALSARVREAREAVGLGALEVFLAPSEGPEVALEPGTPDRLVVGLSALTELDAGALSFLLVRGCELSRAGFALASQAGVDGLAGLVRCALAACGADLAVPEPFDAMVEATTDAVRSFAPPDLIQLVPAASRAVSDLDAGLLLDAMELSAARVALVVCGEPGAALRAVAAASEAGIRTIPGATALALTCLRDDWLALRRAAHGDPG
jgi:hypothetical protein